MSKKAKGNDTAGRKAATSTATPRVITTLRVVSRGRGFKKTWERRTV